MEKKGEQYAQHANKGKREMIFKEGDICFFAFLSNKPPTSNKPEICTKEKAREDNPNLSLSFYTHNHQQ
ncbi:hypothetical protein CR513_47739, partial [Mucuna pruriens]